MKELNLESFLLLLRSHRFEQKAMVKLCGKPQAPLHRSSLYACPLHSLICSHHPDTPVGSPPQHSKQVSTFPELPRDSLISALTTLAYRV